jgi:uncharacterized protein YqeY
MSTVRSRLQSALRAAMKERDAVAMSALRSALSAIANAEAVPVPSGPVPSGQRPVAPPSESVPIAGSVPGGAEVARRAVTEEEAAAIAAAEAAGRRAAAVDYRAAGHADRADRLVRVARVIESALEKAAPGDGA